MKVDPPSFQNPATPLCATRITNPLRNGKLSWPLFLINHSISRNQPVPSGILYHAHLHHHIACCSKQQSRPPRSISPVNNCWHSSKKSKLSICSINTLPISHFSIGVNLVKILAGHLVPLSLPLPPLPSPPPPLPPLPPPARPR